MRLKTHNRIKADMPVSLARRKPNNPHHQCGQDHHMQDHWIQCLRNHVVIIPVLRVHVDGSRTQSGFMKSRYSFRLRTAFPKLIFRGSPNLNSSRCPFHSIWIVRSLFGFLISSRCAKSSTPLVSFMAAWSIPRRFRPPGNGPSCLPADS